MEDLQQPWTVMTSAAIAYTLAGFRIYAAFWLFVLGAQQGVVRGFSWYIPDSWVFAVAVINLVIAGLTIFLAGRLMRREYNSWLTLVIVAGASALLGLVGFPAGLFDLALSVAVLIMLLSSRTRTWLGKPVRG